MDISGYLDRPFSYDAVGILARHPDPAALAQAPEAAQFHRVEVHEVIGSGWLVFDEASRRILNWDMHRRAGLRVRATATPAKADAVVVLALGPIPVPCRVIAADHGATRRGFVYGTLRGHPESGEESFHVEFDPTTEQVSAHIRAVSRPGNVIVAIGGPVNRWAQSIMTRRYVRALTSP